MIDLEKNRFCSPRVRCPFYRWHTLKEVSCTDGESGFTNLVMFDAPEKRRNFMEQFCHTGYADCMIYKMLEEKYEGSGKDE